MSRLPCGKPKLDVSVSPNVSRPCSFTAHQIRHLGPSRCKLLEINNVEQGVVNYNPVGLVVKVPEGSAGTVVSLSWIDLVVR